MQAAFMAQRFQVAGRLVTVDAIGGGNVNETYQAIFRTVYSEERFFLQRISPNVFKEPEQVMENMLYVTSFVHQRLEEEAPFSDRIWQLPRIIPAKDGKYFTIDGDGFYWRAITAIASASSYNSIQSPEHAYEIGAVLGHFHRIFSELDVTRLYDTLPGFHITPQYLAQLDQVLTDLNSVFFNSDLCEAVLLGYKEHSRNFLTDADKEYLYDAIRLITLELAIRFFTDYLAGDTYFKIHHSGQNLERARVQVKLCQSIEARRPQIKRLADAL